MSSDVVVLLSGGLDSTTLAAMALADGRLHSVLSFYYGQPNTIAEMSAADEWARKHDVRREVVKLELAGVRSAMATGVGSTGARVLPGRNLVLLSHAVNYAAANGAREVWFGAIADDNDAYPDCRLAFVGGVNQMALTTYGVGVRAPFIIHHKRHVVGVARQLGVNIGATWSCYEPDMRTLKPCGTCSACVLRASALSKAAV